MGPWVCSRLDITMEALVSKDACWVPKHYTMLRVWFFRFMKHIMNCAETTHSTMWHSNDTINAPSVFWYEARIASWLVAILILRYKTTCHFCKKKISPMFINLQTRWWPLPIEMKTKPFIPDNLKEAWI